MKTNFLNNKKIWLWAVSGVFVVFGFLWWLGIIGFWADNVKDYFLERSRDQYFQNAEKESALLKELYKNDTYGGDTPEETLGMFVKALENKDFELASKYYVTENRKLALDKLEEFLHLDKYIDILNYSKKGFSLAGSYLYEIDFYLNGEQVHVERFILNKETNKWKILDL